MTPELNLLHRAAVPAAAALRPAVVLVHGWLGNEHSMAAFERTLPAGAAAFSPRAPFIVDSGFGWYLDRALTGTTFAEGLTALRQFVLDLPRAYPIDPARITLMGFSQGAAISAALALAAPELVQRLALLAGCLPEPAYPWALPGRLVGKPVFMVHGENDATIPVAEARRARDALQAAGAAMVYGEYPIGHKLTAQGMRDLKTWLAGE